MKHIIIPLFIIIVLIFGSLAFYHSYQYKKLEEKALNAYYLAEQYFEYNKIPQALDQLKLVQENYGEVEKVKNLSKQLEIMINKSIFTYSLQTVLTKISEEKIASLKELRLTNTYNTEKLNMLEKQADNIREELKALEKLENDYRCRECEIHMQLLKGKKKINFDKLDINQ